MGFAEGAQPALNQRRIGQHPPVQGGVIDLQAALEEQLLDVTIAQRVAEVHQETACRIRVASKWRPLKSSLDRRFSFSTRAFRIMAYLRTGGGRVGRYA